MGRGGVGGGYKLREGGEKAEILDFFVEFGGGIVGRWSGWDHIFIHVGQVRHLSRSGVQVHIAVWGGFGLVSRIVLPRVEINIMSGTRPAAFKNAGAGFCKYNIK